MKQGDIVLVPFPYSDLTSSKVRPALVVSNNSLKGTDVILLGISTRSWAQSIPLGEDDLEEGTIIKISYIRYGSILTIERSLVRRRVGYVKPEKMKMICQALGKILSPEVK